MRDHFRFQGGRYFLVNYPFNLTGMVHRNRYPEVFLNSFDIILRIGILNYFETTFDLILKWVFGPILMYFRMIWIYLSAFLIRDHLRFQGGR
jgi:hypothetical protein